MVSVTAIPQTQKTQTPSPATTSVVVYDLDAAHSRAEFAVKHMMIATVRGHIPILGGTLEQRGERDVRVKAELDVKGISTGSDQRDAHLRSPDFFDAESHPAIAFESTGFDGETLEGNLTIRGVTRPVRLAVTKEGEGRDPWGNWKVAVTATTTLDRTQWGLTWNAALETGGVLVSDKVKVTLELQFAKRG